MVDLSSLVAVFWRPDIVWATGSFSFQDISVLFVVSIVFAVAVYLAFGSGGRRVFSAVAFPIFLFGWVLGYPYFMGLGGVEVAGGFGLIGDVFSVVGGNIGTILLFLVLWSAFELLVVRGLMKLVSIVLHHPLEAHVDAWVVGPVIEEYAFRWVLMGLLLAWGVDIGLAILVQGFLFAIGSLKYVATSLSNIWVAVINANIVIPLGFVLGYVAVAYGLFYAFILHVAFNVVFDTVSTMAGAKAE